jgi:hypothetical protein
MPEYDCVSEAHWSRTSRLTASMVTQFTAREKPEIPSWRRPLDPCTTFLTKPVHTALRLVTLTASWSSRPAQIIIIIIRTSTTTTIAHITLTRKQGNSSYLTNFFIKPTANNKISRTFNRIYTHNRRNRTNVTRMPFTLSSHNSIGSVLMKRALRCNIRHLEIAKNLHSNIRHLELEKILHSIINI